MVDHIEKIIVEPYGMNTAASGFQSICQSTYKDPLMSDISNVSENFHSLVEA